MMESITRREIEEQDGRRGIEASKVPAVREKAGKWPVAPGNGKEKEHALEQERPSRKL